MASTHDYTGAGASDVRYISWSAVFAGALIAAAMAAVLHAFAGAVGISVTSLAPTWRDSSIGLALLTGAYLILMALVSYGLGGYVAGWLRPPAIPAVSDRDAHDGAHGLVVWAIATLITVSIAVFAAAASSRLAAPSSGPAGPATSVAGENIIAFDLDRLLRSEKRPADTDMAATRAEAARILLSSSSHAGVQPEDRSYLVRLVAARTGINPAEGEKRVEAAISNARDNIARARRNAVILAFMAGASALLGAVAAWYASAIGGRHRDTSARSSWWAFGLRNRETEIPS